MGKYLLFHSRTPGTGSEYIAKNNPGKRHWFKTSTVPAIVKTKFLEDCKQS